MFKITKPVHWVIFLWSFFVYTTTAQDLFSSGDTVKLDINQSYFDGSDVEVPVIINSSATVFAVDMAIRFNTNRITFDSLTNIINGLQYLYYLNPNDSIWRVTSYLPSGITPGSTVFNLRFSTADNEVCAYDFSDQQAFINGDSSVFQTIGCMDNLGIVQLGQSASTYAYPNPFYDRFYINAGSKGDVQVLDFQGRVILNKVDSGIIDASAWAAGTYFIRIVGRYPSRPFKIVKALP